MSHPHHEVETVSVAVGVMEGAYNFVCNFGGKRRYWNSLLIIVGEADGRPYSCFGR